MTEHEAINELNSCHAFGLSSECRSLAKLALEKQIPKKPKEVKGVYDLLKPVCPVCGNDFLGEYCDECGQRIDWD